MGGTNKDTMNDESPVKKKLQQGCLADFLKQHVIPEQTTHPIPAIVKSTPDLTQANTIELNEIDEVDAHNSTACNLPMNRNKNKDDVSEKIEMTLERLKNRILCDSPQ